MVLILSNHIVECTEHWSYQGPRVCRWKSTCGCHRCSFTITLSYHYHHKKMLSLVSNLCSISSSLIGCCSVSCSGKRKLTVTGSHLEFVEGIVHEHKQTDVRPPIQEVKPPRDSNLQVGLSTNTMLHCIIIIIIMSCCITVHRHIHPNMLKYSTLDC